MRYIKLDLLTLLISLFILSSCEKKGTIGLDIAPTDSIKSAYTEALTVNTVTVRDDSVTVVTSGLSQNPFGLHKDPVFGTTEANLALGLNLPTQNLTFGTSPTLDSAVLVLKYGKEFYGDSVTSKYAINVYQLPTDSAYDFSRTYYNGKPWVPANFTSTAPIGSLTNIKSFLWNDSTFAKVLVKNGPDVTKGLAPQIRIKLSNAFVNSNFLNADPANFATSTAFTKAIRGLYVTIDKTQSTGKGGIIFFDLQSTTISGLEIYYKSTTSTGGKDTSMVFFSASGASNIKHDYAGTPVQTQLTNSTQTYSTVYAQPLAGLRTKIKFPNVSTLKQNGPVSINKAQLVIPVVNGSDALPFKPAPRLTLYTIDIASQRRPVPDNAIGQDNRYMGERTFNGFYNSTDKTYVFNITSYIQDLVNKPIVQYETYIAPFDLPLTGRSNIFPSATTAARSVLGPIKLQVTYTKPK